jgi:hypothetical protein
MGTHDMVIKESAQLPVIEFNFEDLKKQAQQIASEYASITITNDTYMDAKADAKKLGRYVADIEKRRKEIKKQLELPVKNFEDQCKELEAILISSQKQITDVTDQYDEKRRQEKISKVNQYVTDTVAKLNLASEYAAMVVPSEQDFNLSSTFKSAQQDIDGKAAKAFAMQTKDAAIRNAAEAAVNIANSNIEQKISMSMFCNEMTKARADADPAGYITAVISAKANSIKEAEERIKEKAAKEAREEAERIAREAREKEIASASVIPETAHEEQVPQKQENAVNSSLPIDISTPLPETTGTSDISSEPEKVLEQNPFGSTTEEPSWEMSIILKGKASDLKNVGHMIASICKANGCEYGVNQTGCHRI